MIKVIKPIVGYSPSKATYLKRLLQLGPLCLDGFLQAGDVLFGSFPVFLDLSSEQALLGPGPFKLPLERGHLPCLFLQLPFFLR